ncbi:EAL domain-containing protein [Deinococcus sp. Arct2-2]|uniref:sensor domain-containing protein n=1 Tax=Deinococcus sp. Arct2-2 TaxID=2568653 RepID=UPI0010A2FE00|nr:bifunctional diguanylate cyclase/phosphodiesterase [Deinococcus sp. Arct2-2]THF67728.1 EAL domain-containing protein [Deinococcus sp. Arct2-2]
MAHLSDELNPGNSTAESSRVQVALDRQQARFRALVLNSWDLTTVLDADGIILYDSPSLQSMLGYLQTERLGRSLATFLHPDDLGAFQLGLQTLKAEPFQPWQVTCRLKHAGGEWRMLEAVWLNRLGDANLRGIVINARDVTERQQLEAELAEERHLFRSLLAAIPDGVYFKDTESRFTHASLGLAHFLGVERSEDLQGKTDFDFMSPDLARAIREDEQRIMTTRETRIGQLNRLKRRDGRFRWISSSKVPLVNAQGEVTGIIGISRDVHRMKRAEQALQHERDFTNTVLELVGSLVIVLDRQGRILRFNRACEVLTGYSAPEVLGQSFWSLFVLPEEKEAVSATFQLLVSGDFPNSLENHWLTRSGEQRLIAWTNTALEDECGAVEFIIGTGQDITAQRQATEVLAYQAHHDALTGLPNRSLFLDRLEQALAAARREGGALAVAFVDLDRFKMVNDTLGHAAGDELLQAVAQRLRGCLREVDTVSRMGGDEFLLLLPGVGSVGEASQVARKVILALAPAFKVVGHNVFVTASLGLSLYPLDAVDAQHLLSHADEAMYQAKEAGKNAFQVFSTEQPSDLYERFELEGELRQAVQRSELKLYYQPLIETQSGKVRGMEALLRWHHPRLGWLSPATFIPIAEESGLIVSPVGEWVLTEACRQNVAWQRAGLPPVRVSVNVSALQFSREDFVETVAAALASSGLEGHWLELELTETLVMRRVSDSARQLARLRELGVSIAIDDFGTGHSSLAYLRQLPIDTLKIDRSFVSGLDDSPSGGTRPLIQAMIAMGHALGLTVVAEGVETEAQLQWLSQQGCDLTQGFLLARPQAPEHLEEFLRSTITSGGEHPLRP